MRFEVEMQRLGCELAFQLLARLMRGSRTITQYDQVPMWSPDRAFRGICEKRQTIQTNERMMMKNLALTFVKLASDKTARVRAIRGLMLLKIPLSLACCTRDQVNENKDESWNWHFACRPPRFEARSPPVHRNNVSPGTFLPCNVAI